MYTYIHPNSVHTVQAWVWRHAYLKLSVLKCKLDAFCVHVVSKPRCVIFFVLQLRRSCSLLTCSWMSINDKVKTQVASSYIEYRNCWLIYVCTKFTSCRCFTDRGAFPNTLWPANEVCSIKYILLVNYQCMSMLLGNSTFAYFVYNFSAKGRYPPITKII